MTGWKELTQAIYYAGTGAVLLSTGFKFFYDKLRKMEKKNEFIQKAEHIHTPAFYRAFKTVEKELGVNLNLPPYEPPTRPKPLAEDSEE
jgi:hypothetical protein